jgi:hypothetical protein
MVDADAKTLAGATPITDFGRLLYKNGKESEAVWTKLSIAGEGRTLPSPSPTDQ